MSTLEDTGPRASAPAPSRALVVAFYALLVLLCAGLVKGALLLTSGEVTTLFPELAGWKIAFPIAGWCGTALSVVGLWHRRWWGLVLALCAAAYELAVELVAGGFAWHVLRLPVFALLLTWFCLALRPWFGTAIRKR